MQRYYVFLRYTRKKLKFLVKNFRKNLLFSNIIFIFASNIIALWRARIIKIIY